jgi:hypothetical protein
MPIVGLHSKEIYLRLIFKNNSSHYYRVVSISIGIWYISRKTCRIFNSKFIKKIIHVKNY